VRTFTILLRGGSKQYIEEVVRSLNDAFMVVRKIQKKPFIVPG